MDLCGEIVVHKAFGSGHIIGFVNKYVTVLFDENKEVKQFIYPSAFGEFLTLENDSFHNQIEVDKSIIAQELAKNKLIAEQLKKSAIPIQPKKARAAPKKKKIAAAAVKITE